jgi:hypothetical protein
VGSEGERKRSDKWGEDVMRTTGAARGTTTADKAAMDDTEHHRAREEQDDEPPRPALISWQNENELNTDIDGTSRRLIVELADRQAPLNPLSSLT